MKDGFEFAGLSTLNQKMLFRLYSLVDTHFFWISIKGIVRLVHELLHRMNEYNPTSSMKSFFLCKRTQSEMDMVVGIRPSDKKRLTVEVFTVGLHRDGVIYTRRLYNDGNRTVAEQFSALIASGITPQWAIVAVQNEDIDLVIELFDLRDADALRKAIDNWHRMLIDISSIIKVGRQNQASA